MVGKKASAVACSAACNQQILAARRKAAKWQGVDPDRPCGHCAAPMTGKRPHAVYCSRPCKDRAHGEQLRVSGIAQERDRARYAREAEQRKAYAREYLAKNPERMRAIRRNRKSRIKAQRFEFTERDWARMKERYRQCCAYCGRHSDQLQREHVIPISRGGRHSVGNIVPACPRCNMSKKAKLLSEWRYRQREVIPHPPLEQSSAA